MNELAHVVHDLVVGGEVDRQEGLSQPEKKALVDLRHLLGLSPKDLAAFLAQGQWLGQRPWPESWPPPERTSKRAQVRLASR